jgi:anhydro-N-acetylmuramic acid kinase
MDALQGELPQANVTTTDSLGIPSAWKESLCFAYLAYRTLGGLHSNVPSVTGAVRSTILGTIALPG